LFDDYDESGSVRFTVRLRPLAQSSFDEKSADRADRNANAIIVVLWR